MDINVGWMECQQSILGSCLIDQRAIGSVVFSLEDEDFEGINRSIFRVIRDQYTRGQPVDAVTVLCDLGSSEEYRRYLMELMEITPTAANIRRYAQLCKNYSRINRYRMLGAELITVDDSSVAAELIRNANHISIGKGMESWTMKEALHAFFARYHKKVEFLPWFLSQLDGQLAMEFGDFCLLGGRPSSGKSAFALEAVAYWGVKCGYRVGFYSHETSREKLTNRMVSFMAGVKLDDVKHSRLTEKDLERVCNLASRVSEAPIDLISCAGKTVAEMQAFALERRHQIVVIDYLQIVSDPGKDEYSQVSSISKQLHVMCQSLGIFCLALCQLNRTKGARPSLEDLRSSGQLEQDADSVMFLHRQEGKDSERELIIAKNKEGECRSTRLYFDGPIQHFQYIGRGDAPIKGVDYLGLRYQAPAQELEQLPMETEVPFT